MSYSWKISDDELFDPEGLPRNGRTAPGRDGDLLDIIRKSVQELDNKAFSERLAHNVAVDKRRQAVIDLMNGDDVDLNDYQIPYINTDISLKAPSLRSTIDKNIDLAQCSDKKFYFGRIPASGVVATISNRKEKIEVNYFSGEYSPSDRIAARLEEATTDVKRLRYYTAPALYELGHIVCKLLLITIKVLLIFFAIREGYLWNGNDHLSFVPVLFSDTPKGPLYLNAFIWLAVGILVTFLSAKMENYFEIEEDYSSVGCFLLACSHAILALRTWWAQFAAFGIYASVALIFYDLYRLALLFPRMFWRMSRTRLVPYHPIRGIYRCSFEADAASLYRYIRLRTIWYETVYQKSAPSDYQNAIEKLEKLDKTYQHWFKVYDKLGFNDSEMLAAIRRQYSK